jgi:hypothetical protein
MSEKSKEAEPGETITGERHLTKAEGKEEQSVFENEDERIRGPLLPSERSSVWERPVYDRDPRHPEGAFPEEQEEITILSRHKKEA